MLIYNTTFHVEQDAVDHFLIWVKECYIPEIVAHGVLDSPRLTRILSHREGEEGENFSLQWEVENSEQLHKWYTEMGMHMNNEINKIFKNKVVGFPTLMEVIA